MCFPNPDSLMSVYYRLARVKNIPNMEQYGHAWECLGNMFARAGRSSMAESCLARANFYLPHVQGSYLRILEGESLSYLVRVS